MLFGYNRWGLLFEEKYPRFYYGRSYAIKRGRSKKERKVVSLPLVPIYVYDLIANHKKLKQLGMGTELFDPEIDEEKKKKIAKRINTILSLFKWNEDLKAGRIKPLEYEHAEPPPYPHQKIGTSLIINNPFYAIFAEQGTGKTRMVVDALCHLARTKGVEKYSKVVVAAPISVLYSGWLGDLEQFATFPYRAFLAISESRAKKIQAIRDWIDAPRDKLNFLLIGYDYIWRLFPSLLTEDQKKNIPDEIRKKFIKAFKKALTDKEYRQNFKEKVRELMIKFPRSGFKRVCLDCLLILDVLDEVDVAIADESQKIKTPKAKRTKAFLYLALNAKRKYILSGTPITNTPFDIFSQALFLHPHFFASQTAFKEYFVDVIRRDKWEDIRGLKKEKVDEFKALINGISFIVKKQDVLKDLPEKIFMTRDVVLSKTTTNLYLQLENQFVVEAEGIVKKIESGEIEERQAVIYAQNILSRMMKLNQLTSGFLKESDEDGGGIIEVGKEKIDTLLEILEELGEKPVVVWANFIYEIDRIVDVLRKRKYEVAKIYGATKNSDRGKIIDDFQAGHYQILVANPATLATGVTLTRASDAIYFSLNFRLEDFLQSQDRIHRIGQEAKSVNYYVLLSRLNPEVVPSKERQKMTIDRKIYQALKQKKKISDDIVSFVKTFLEELKDSKESLKEALQT